MYVTEKRDQADFERFRTAVLGAEPDRVPLSEVHIDTEIKQAFLGREIATAGDDVAFWHAAGYDYVIMRVGGQPVPDVSAAGDTGFAAQGGPSHRWARPSHQGAITNWDEFRAYGYITADDLDFRQIDAYAGALIEGMRVIVNVGPVFSGVWRTMGLEAFCVATAETPDLVRAVHDKLGELIVEIVERAVAHPGVGAIWLGDDIAFAEALMASPDVLRAYAFPWYRRVGDLCRQADKPLIYHSDGKLWDVLEDLIDAGIRAVNPIEPKAMDIIEIKKRFGNRLALIGNVGVDLLARGTKEAVIEETIRLLCRVAPGGGYCLGSGNSIPYYVPLENWIAMVNTALARGRYPISE